MQIYAVYQRQQAKFLKNFIFTLYFGVFAEQLPSRCHKNTIFAPIFTVNYQTICKSLQL